MKRLIDIVASIILIILLSPVLLIITILLKCSEGGTVLFKQKRVGLNNELFTIYKFRTLQENIGDMATEDIDVEHQVLKIGKILRVTSLDELPQLFNILNGTMSFVGPRPLIPAEKEIRELREQYGVYSVRPGMTGLAQINGRDNLDYKEKALLDREYVENQSLAYDFKIVFKTFSKVLKRDDIKDGK